MSRTSAIGALIGLIVSPLLLWLAIRSGGAEPRSYSWVFLFFPLLTFAMPFLRALVIPFALLQYPLYGWFIASRVSERQFLVHGIMAIVIHLVPIMIALSWLPEHLPRRCRHVVRSRISA